MTRVGILAADMDKEPLSFLESTVPAQFEKGLAALRASTAPTAKEDLEDVLTATGCVRVIVEGDGERWVGVHEGAMSVTEAKPSLPVRGVFAFSSEAARGALELLEESGRLDDPKAAMGMARVASKKAEKILTGQRIEFHVIIKDLPDDAEDVVIRCGIGVEEAPAKPQFTAAISYDDLEDMREGDLTPQQVIGRLKLTGDASRAMALGMTLFTPPKKGAVSPPGKK
jgi:putative sterol carrier protein